MFHSLLNILDSNILFGHPKVGAYREGLAIEQVVSILHIHEAYFWATHGGAELDLLFLHNGKRYGVEVMFSDVKRLE